MNIDFGTVFTQYPDKGDLFIRVDVLPNRLFRYTGDKWIEIPKTRTTSYLGNEEYIKHILNDISAGKIKLEDLTEDEQEEIQKFLGNE